MCLRRESLGLAETAGGGDDNMICGEREGFGEGVGGVGMLTIVGAGGG